MCVTFVFGLRVQNPRFKYPFKLCQLCLSFPFTLWWNCALCHVFSKTTGIILGCIVESHEGIFFLSFGPLCLLLTEVPSPTEKEGRRMGIRLGEGLASVWVSTLFLHLPHSHTLSLFMLHRLRHTHISGGLWKRAWWLMTLCERPQRELHYREMDRWKGRRSNWEMTEMNRVTGWGCSAAVNILEPECCIVGKTPWK